MAYKMAKRLIETGRTNNIMDKLDAWMANDKITPKQYSELVEMLPLAE